MKKGEVWWVDFEPTVGGEIKKIRPAIVVSNNLANRFLNRCQVVPLTSNTEKVFAGEVLIAMLGRTNKACIDQIRTVSKKRFKRKVTQLDKGELRKVLQKMRDYFELDDL